MLFYLFGSFLFLNACGNSNLIDDFLTIESHFYARSFVHQHSLTIVLFSPSWLSIHILAGWLYIRQAHEVGLSCEIALCLVYQLDWITFLWGVDIWSTHTQVVTGGIW